MIVLTIDIGAIYLTPFTADVYANAATISLPFTVYVHACVIFSRDKLD